MKFLTGKKTYIAAAVLALVGIAGFWYDLIPLAEASLVLGAALGLIGLGDKANRILELLNWLKTQQRLKAGVGQPSPAGQKDEVDELLKKLSGGGAKK